jgi:hypothetical protein
MTIIHMRHLARLTAGELSALVDRLSVGRKRGRPWSRSLRRRILIACVALRTNLTFRELAVVFRISKSTAHRMVASITAQLAAAGSPDLPIADTPRDQWIVDGTLPTRDHQRENRRATDGRAMRRLSCAAAICASLPPLRAVQVIATMSCTTGALPSKSYVDGTVGYSPMVDTVECPSS